MLNITRRFLMLVALCCTGALAACLPDERDPAAVTDAGRLTGSYYAAGLGNVALQIQNTVVSDASWFENLTGSMELNLANMGITPKGLGASVKSYICPTGTGNSVRQITWIDGRDASGKFNLRGIGTDVGAIVGALRTRLSGEQVGTYISGEGIGLATGERTPIPASCSGLSIPEGAPVVVFNIDRPAIPSSDMARTEYRTQSCGVDSSGRDRRGTLVQKRTVRYGADGSIFTGNWEMENMGQCVDDVVVQVTDRNFHEGERAADLNNFAAIALRNLLQQQLQMDCTTANVQKDDGVTQNKTIDTCAQRVQGQGRRAIEQTGTGAGTDVRYLSCGGSAELSVARFINLYGPGTSSTLWTAGGATIIRVVDTSTRGQGQEGARDKWLGTDINCTGHEDFYVGCGYIPNAPGYEPRQSWTKWLEDPIQGYMVSTGWFQNVFGCRLGGCTEVVGGYLRYLNPAYFTGVDHLQNGGVYSRREMAATSWINPETFRPLALPSTAWRITNNQCLWSRRVMVVECPFNVDPSQQGTWYPGSVSPYAPMPTALDPGIGSNGTTAGQIYASSLITGTTGMPGSSCNMKGCQNVINSAYREARLTSTVAMLWKKCNIKGCNTWWETAGPGEGVYIKSWNMAGVDLSKILLTGTAMRIRDDLCADIAFKLDATTAAADAAQRATEALANANAKKAVHDAAQAALTAAQTALAVAQSDYNMAVVLADGARQTADTRQADAVAKRNDATTKRADAVAKRDIANQPGATQAQINAANAAEAAADTAETAADTAEASAQSAEQQAQARESERLAAASTRDAAQALLTTRQAEAATAASAYSTAEAASQAAQQAAAEAQSAAASGSQTILTDQQRAELTEIRGSLCTSTEQALSATEQNVTRTVCSTYYANTAQYTYLPALGLYCDSVFDRDAAGNLSFKPRDLSSLGANVQTTLLNTDGLRLAYRPRIEENKYMNVRQNGVVDPLYCARNEERYHNWPVLQYYVSCGGKGGCRWNSYYTTTTITEATVREWSGYTYESGTWSQPVYGLRSPYGNWSNWSQIPNPIVAY